MRHFIQRRAGVSFFQEQDITVAYRKEYIEYIFKHQQGWYFIVNAVIVHGGVLLFTYWNDFFDRIFDVLPGIMFGKEQCPSLQNLLRGKTGNVSLSTIMDPESGNQFDALAIEIKTDIMRNIVEIIGTPSVVKAAEELVDFSLRLRSEIIKSPFTSLKELL